jgi:hypothetical protein
MNLHLVLILSCLAGSSDDPPPPAKLVPIANLSELRPGDVVSVTARFSCTQKERQEAMVEGERFVINVFKELNDFGKLDLDDPNFCKIKRIPVHSVNGGLYDPEDIPVVCEETLAIILDMSLGGGAGYPIVKVRILEGWHKDLVGWVWFDHIALMKISGSRRDILNISEDEIIDYMTLADALVDAGRRELAMVYWRHVARHYPNTADGRLAFKRLDEKK